MSYQVELVSCPPLWSQLSGDSFETAKADFLGHADDDSQVQELKIEMDDSDEAPF